MINFLFNLSTNLALLAFVLATCHLCNRFFADATLNGSHIFVALAIAAFLFDAALTFLVFADSRNRYGQFSTTSAFVERACAYCLAILVAFAWRHVARRRDRATKPAADKALVIHTSPYTESNLPM